MGPKQVYRRRGSDGRFREDILATADEAPPAWDAEPLLEVVMQGGRLLHPHPRLTDLRARCAVLLAALPADVRRLRSPAPYLVRYSAALTARQEATRVRLVAAERPEQAILTAASH